jgi:nucleotide-binding universal stress UspA family protein
MAALRVESGPMHGSALILHGGAVVRILEQEQEDDCDLIVVGKRSESRVADFFLGSVTRRVLAESQADVLVVPVPASPGATSIADEH